MLKPCFPSCSWSVFEKAEKGDCSGRVEGGEVMWDSAEAEAAKGRVSKSVDERRRSDDRLVEEEDRRRIKMEP